MAAAIEIQTVKNKDLLLWAVLAAGAYWMWKNRGRQSFGPIDNALKLPPIKLLDPAAGLQTIRAPTFVAPTPPSNPVADMSYYYGSDGLVR